MTSLWINRLNGSEVLLVLHHRYYSGLLTYRQLMRNLTGQFGTDYLLQFHALSNAANPSEAAVSKNPSKFRKTNNNIC